MTTNIQIFDQVLDKALNWVGLALINESRCINHARRQSGHCSMLCSLYYKNELVGSFWHCINDKLGYSGTEVNGREVKGDVLMFFDYWVTEMSKRIELKEQKQ